MVFGLCLGISCKFCNSSQTFFLKVYRWCVLTWGLSTNPVHFVSNIFFCGVGNDGLTLSLWLVVWYTVHLCTYMSPPSLDAENCQETIAPCFEWGQWGKILPLLFLLTSKIVRNTKSVRKEANLFWPIGAQQYNLHGQHRPITAHFCKVLLINSGSFWCYNIYNYPKYNIYKYPEADNIF